MKILRSSLNIATELSNSFLFLDTNALIAALTHQEFAELLYEIKEKGCCMLTIGPVVIEFLRGTDSVKSYNIRADFVNDLTTVYPVERFLNNERDLILVMKKVCGNAEYADFLLGICLGKFAPNAYLLTENHHHFPSALFKREYIITTDNPEQIRNYALYTVSIEKFTKITGNLT